MNTDAKAAALSLVSPSPFSDEAIPIIDDLIEGMPACRLSFVEYVSCWALGYQTYCSGREQDWNVAVCTGRAAAHMHEVKRISVRYGPKLEKDKEAKHE